MSNVPVDDQNRSVDPDPSEILPPVEPPSAKFIVQLFVVPGLIVAAIIGAWLLFGKLASAEQDWQALLADMKSSNENRRGRGAMGLAQALAADQNRRSDDSRPRLATNPQVAQELSAFLTDTLKSSSTEPAVVDQQAFLTRTLGMLDVPETVLPVLQDAMSESRDREVRKNAVLAIATIAHRASEQGTPLKSPETVEALTLMSRDSDSLLRTSATFAMGFLPLELVSQPLSILLADSDANTRANAAVAFTRHKSLEGLPVFREILKSSANQKTPPSAGDSSLIATTAALKAVGELSELLDESTRSEIRRDVEAISQKFPEPRIRLDAAQSLTKLGTR